MSNVDAIFFNFKSEGQFTVTGRGICHAVTNPRECYDFDHLIGAEVLIDGQLRKVLGVERFMHSAPWRAGEKIGLLVTE